MSSTSLALTFFLFFSFTASAASDDVEITYGSVVKMMHEKTKFRLHSHDLPYGSGSGQQSVTGFPTVDDANSYWIVRPELGTSAKQGDPILSATIIRLQHMTTSGCTAIPLNHPFQAIRRLVSVYTDSVSCFGNDGKSDTGDHWRLIVEGTGKMWMKDQKVRLQHVDTGVYLHSHKKKYGMGQQEVCGVINKQSDNIWMAAEGVYFPVNKSKYTLSDTR